MKIRKSNYSLVYNIWELTNFNKQGCNIGPEVRSHAKFWDALNFEKGKGKQGLAISYSGLAKSLRLHNLFPLKFPASFEFCDLIRLILSRKQGKFYKYKDRWGRH